MKKKNILVIGGSGYVGSHIIDYVEECNFINISKSRANDKVFNNILIDITKGLDFLRFSEKIDIIINCTDIIDCGEDKKNSRCYANSMQKLIYFANKIGVKKIIHFSNHVEPKESRSDYVQNKLLADRVIEHSGLEFIIFRMTQIFGEESHLDVILKRLSNLKVLSKTLAHKKLSPVFIGDVIRNVRYAIQNDDCWNKSYVICGPEQLDIEEAINRYASKKLKTVNMPEVFSKMYMRYVLDKNIRDFYESYIDLEPKEISCKYPRLLKPLKFY